MKVRHIAQQGGVERTEQPGDQARAWIVDPAANVVDHQAGSGKQQALRQLDQQFMLSEKTVEDPDKDRIERSAAFQQHSVVVETLAPRQTAPHGGEVVGVGPAVY